MMRLALCSSASPEATLPALAGACARRGLAGVELREGDAHGMNPDCEEFAEILTASRVSTDAVPLVGYRASTSGHDLWLGRLSLALDVPILLDGSTGVRSRLRRAGGIASVGGRVAVVLRGGDATTDGQVASCPEVDVAWDADPRQHRLGDRVARLLDLFDGRLRHLRLLGRGARRRRRVT